MRQHRFVITDRLWRRIAPLLPGKATDRGVTARDNRLFLEAVLWRVRTGAPWRDLPTCFGNWNSQFRRFRRWATSGVLQRVFEALSGDPDLEYGAHRRDDCPGSPESCWGKRGSRHQCIGRSRGGLTTKIVALVDALGNLVRFLLLPGQRHESKGAAPLLGNLPFGALLADKAFDNDGLLRELQARGATAVIPPKANRKQQRPYDREVYKWRHLIENFFARIKEYRGSATRYDKTASSYAANWRLVATLLAST